MNAADWTVERLTKYDVELLAQINNVKAHAKRGRLNVREKWEIEQLEAERGQIRDVLASQAAV